jgi:hypothetical protein
VRRTAQLRRFDERPFPSNIALFISPEPGNAPNGGARQAAWGAIPSDRNRCFVGAFGRRGCASASGAAEMIVTQAHWISDSEDFAHAPPPSPRGSAARLMALARRKTGLDDFGAHSVEEALEHLLRAYQSEADLNVFGRHIGTTCGCSRTC